MQYTNAAYVSRGGSIPALVRPHCLLLAMHRSHSIPGALALIASSFAFFAMSAVPVHAVEPLPDARILSATPFDFRADRDIFSRMPAEHGDSRIFKPTETVRSASEARLMTERFTRQPTI
ncbi:hypothetical protein BG58_10100 [Caballeronia jiangsuensis]|nr:hypothetical protein BG58_10100 [Caballeronia jiangsuensis]